MAAYVALVSLMNIIDNIQNHPRVSNFFYKKQLECLRQKLDLLIDFVENRNSHGGISKEEIKDLESQIASAGHATEDAIESHIVNQIQSGSTERSPSFLLDLQKVFGDMDSMIERVIEVEERGSIRADRQPECAVPPASSRPLTTENTTVLGFDGYLVQILDWLTAGQQSDRHMITITGMAGIGKSTLARFVYENPLTVQHFDVCAWVTVSQEYNVKKILLDILSCLRVSANEKDTVDLLGEQLHKFLFGRRYLVILDDMWSIEAWNSIKFFFPENNYTSRIVVTTRQLEIVHHCGSLGLALEFLDDDRSWDLFCQKAFSQGSCPLELVKIGKEIVKKCRGLPLSIVVIGGLLGKSSKTQENWENVAKDIISNLISVEDNQCLNILSLSYDHLPTFLKPLFLYLGIFPEDHDISVSRLIKLWVGEGFLKPQKEQCLEEVAYGYIKDLIDRNLIFVRRLTSNGEVKTCNIHDLLRDLCIKVAEKEKFFCVIRKVDTPQDIDRHRRIIIHESIGSEEYFSRLCDTFKSAARSVIGSTKCQVLLKARLLRVLSRGHGDPFDTSLQRVNLRFLHCYYTSNNHGSPTYNLEFLTHKLPTSISLFWNLQTLVIKGVARVVAPSEILGDATP